MRCKRCFHLGKAHFNQNRGTYDTKGFPLHEMIQCMGCGSYNEFKLTTHGAIDTIYRSTQLQGHSIATLHTVLSTGICTYVYIPLIDDSACNHTVNRSRKEVM